MNLIHKYGKLKQYNSSKKKKKKKKDRYTEVIKISTFLFDTFFSKNILDFNLITNMKYENVGMNLYCLIASISNVAFWKHMYGSIIR